MNILVFLSRFLTEVFQSLWRLQENFIEAPFGPFKPERRRSEKKLKDVEIENLLRKCDDIVEGSNEIEVKECGIPQINGTHHKFGTRDGVPLFKDCQI